MLGFAECTVTEPGEDRGRGAAPLERDVEVGDFSVGPPLDVATGSEVIGVDDDAEVSGVILDMEWRDPRTFEGTTVCVEVVEIEEDEDEDDGAGEYDLMSAEDNGGGVGAA